jgi:hypothetical protein
VKGVGRLRRRWIQPHSVVVRYNPDGSIDTGFGTDGVVSLELNHVAIR